MSPRTLAVSGALLICLAAPAGAGAATITPLAKPCFVTVSTPSGPQVEPVQFAASGFTPNSLVDLAIDGVPVPNGTSLLTDANGAIGTLQPLEVPAPFVAKGSKEFTISLTEQGNAANVATATAKSTALGVTVKPKRAKPSSIISFRGSGFTLDRAVYAHYLYGGKVRATVKMSGKPGECGSWKTKAKQIPVSDPKTGIWTVQFDQSKKYINPAKGKLDSSFVQLRISVTRTLRPA